MANSLYDQGRQDILGGNIAWLSATIKLVFTNHSIHTPNVTSDAHLSDISAATVATSGAFTSPTDTAGVADAADVTVTAVSGSAFASVNIYKDTGTGSTSTLIAYIDTATGLPLTPNGGDITVSWDNGSNRIFKL